MTQHGWLWISVCQFDVSSDVCEWCRCLRVADIVSHTGIASMMIPMIMTIDHGPSPRMFSMMSRIHTTSCGSTVSV